MKAVWTGERFEDFADRVRQADNLAQAIRDAFDAAFVQGKPVKHGFRRALLFAALQILRVCGNDGIGFGDQCVGHGKQGRIFLFRGQTVELRQGRLGFRCFFSYFTHDQFPPNSSSI
ncbi:hypothetical protein D1872_298980 [compost metagenome]